MKGKEKEARKLLMEAEAGGEFTLWVDSNGTAKKKESCEATAGSGQQESAIVRETRENLSRHKASCYLSLSRWSPPSLRHNVRLLMSPNPSDPTRRDQCTDTCIPVLAMGWFW